MRYGARSISVEIAHDGANAYINVSDDGNGVGSDERERIFEPGVRGSAAAALPGGAGLGLALGRRLARSAGGEIHAAPSDTGGHFSVRLPIG
jgi:signal transduction histidine kinase